MKFWRLRGRTRGNGFKLPLQKFGTKSGFSIISFEQGHTDILDRGLTRTAAWETTDSVNTWFCSGVTEMVGDIFTSSSAPSPPAPTPPAGRRAGGWRR